MYHILVFDDDSRGGKRTKEILEEFAGKCGKVFEIELVYDEESLMEYIRNHSELDVIFLDIHVKEGADGINMAKQINDFAPQMPLIFLTGYIEYATEVYDARHVYFVLKEELKQRLPKVFERLEDMAADRNKGYLYFHIKGKEVVVREEEIRYIERKGRSTFTVCKGRTIEMSEKLSGLEQKLNPVSFVRCHHSYIVNFMAVREFTRTEFTLDDDSIIPVSRYKLEETRRKFLEWTRR